VFKSYQFTKLRPLSVKICAILYAEYRPNIANMTKKTLKSKLFVVFILSVTVRVRVFETANAIILRWTRDIKAAYGGPKTMGSPFDGGTIDPENTNTS
jgi:hypothetical protein